MNKVIVRVALFLLRTMLKHYATKESRAYDKLSSMKEKAAKYASLAKEAEDFLNGFEVK